MPTRLTISTHAGTSKEERGREQLLRLLDTYDLDRWLFTREVIIRSNVIAHSHPVLTLNTRQLEDDEGLLGTFLHEQFHWYELAHLDCVECAIEAFRKLFPEAPVGAPEGGNTERSTYLHFITCTLEFDALRVLLDAERARRVLADRPYYRWIYRQVLDNCECIREVLNRHSLELL